MNLSNGTKFFLTISCFVLAILGFLIKLPSVFQHHDKEMHSLFYFLAAAFLNILFAKRNIIVHVAIFIFLYVFGVAIEYAQEYSNKFFHKKIHGRYDVEDLQSNLKGLIIFSILWIVYSIIVFVYNKSSSRGNEVKE